MLPAGGAAALAFAALLGCIAAPAMSAEPASATAPAPAAVAPTAPVATPSAPAPGPATASPSAAVAIGNPELTARLDAGGTLVVAGERLEVGLLRRFYAGHGEQTVWDTHVAQAAALWKAVLHAEDQGLDPALFHAAIRERAPALSPVERDLLYSDAFLSYADALARGAMPLAERPDYEILSPGDTDVAAALDRAIAAPDPARVIADLAPSSPQYRTMRRAYAEYRAIVAGHAAVPGPESERRHGGVNGRVLAERRLQQLAVNLERLRWLPRVMPPDRIVVNTAIQRLQLFRDNQPVFATRVVVGQPTKQTPEFHTAVTSVLFNPPWYVPRSILRSEILPKLAEDPDYLWQHHMRFRNAWSVEQLPGPDAALGQIKFEMPDRFDVYLHDTPQKYFFRRSSRMLSHGCVRVENPRELAALVLQEPPEAIAEAIDRRYTHRQALPTPLAVFIVYQTSVAEADGEVRFYADRYQRDDAIWQWLNRARQEPVAQESGAGQRKG